jgi:hypothetical protein
MMQPETRALRVWVLTAVAISIAALGFSIPAFAFTLVIVLHHH